MSSISQFIKIYICLIVLCISQLTTFGQHNKVESEINAIMKEFDAVGLSVAVVKNGKIIYKHSFGLKNIESNTPLTDQDIFRIASISKSFSGTSIMQLIEAKKMKLSDDFSDLVGFKV